MITYKCCTLQDKIKDYKKYMMGYTQFNDDVFVVDCWPDNKEKENVLIQLLNRLKVFNCPIILCGHYPVTPEIQKLADYYLYDSNNDVLLEKDFEEYGVHSDSWVNFNDYKLTNKIDFHHDYAIWLTMKNAFALVKKLGKKHIHFLEYDNLPDEVQYRQSFMEYIGNYDVVIHEYFEGSTREENPYCATYIFSIKTDVALEMISKINSKEEYFKNKPNRWQLEKVFYQTLSDMGARMFVSKYIPNEDELNIFAAWNRNGIVKGGTRIRTNLGVDNGQLFIHFISGFHERPADKDYLLEIIYDDYKKFITLKKGEYKLERLGEYIQGKNVNVYHQGMEVFSQELKDDVEEFTRKNNLVRKTKSTNRRVNINFIDGPFVEIIENGDNLYRVEFINKKTNKIEYQLNLRSNHWSRCSLKYYVDWLIRIKGIDNDYVHEHHLNLENKRVLIAFESKSLGDTLSFFPYVEKFRVDNNCNVIVSTFNNELFINQYPEIEFVQPGTNVNGIHALYRLGLFFKTHSDGVRKINIEYHPIDPKTVPLSKIPSDTLGLDYVELRPKLPQLGEGKKKVVCIGPHSTAQAKYWNNPTGWQEVVNHLNDKGYEVRLLSREEDGYMGNRNPTGVVQQPRGPLTDVLKTLQESELFIGLGSGLSWLAWSANIPVILISGFSDDYTEPVDGVSRIINKNVCNSCWNRHDFDPGDWNWCPDHKGTNRQFECSRNISAEQVIKEIDRLIS